MKLKINILHGVIYVEIDVKWKCINSFKSYLCLKILLVQGKI